MKDEVFNARLTEARQRIESLPDEKRAPLMNLLQETKNRHHELKQSFSKVHEAVDEWRLMMKYLVFDRDALKRECESLRRRLDSDS